jgi:predicted amidohydrolase
VNGKPKDMLKELAKNGNAYVGGSFLAQSGADVYNTFVLACPDGRTFEHDKDFPSTAFESSVYAGGEDAEFVRLLKSRKLECRPPIIPSRQESNADGVFEIDGLSVGVALCWELVRYRTARRLAGRIEMLLGASGWWWSDPEFGWPDDRTKDEIGRHRAGQKELIREAPRRLARMLGVPVVHANFCGVNRGYLTSKFETEVVGRYLGESQIVDNRGKTLIHLSDEEGVIVQDVVLGRDDPTEEMGNENEWMPEFDERAKISWHESGAKGRNHYVLEVRPRLNR